MKSKLALRVAELSILVKLMVAYCVSFFYFKEKELWLISERGYEARDNAYFFFRYLLEQHPEINAKYIIKKGSPDEGKFADVRGRVVWHGSFLHYLYLWKAKYLISTHIMGYTTFPTFFVSLDKVVNLFSNSKKIFLQHGIIGYDLVGLYADHVKLDLFCCGGKVEYEYVRDNFGHHDRVVKYTGLCRYDNLMDVKLKKQILLMPTWRMHIDKSRFEETDYYKKYSELLQSPSLHRLLDDNGYELIFYPHYEVQPLLGSFKKLNLPPNVKVAGFEYDVQTLLIESKMLITDYSSVFFDMAYMRKPIVFFTFDEDSFHYKKGYFRSNFLGDVATTVEDVVSFTGDVVSTGFQMKPQHLSYVNDFFLFHDKKNCERVFEAILNS